MVIQAVKYLNSENRKGLLIASVLPNMMLNGSVFSL